MNSADLRAWQAHMGFTYEQAAASLGLSRTGFSKYVSLKYEGDIPRWLELSCAAVAAGLHTWVKPHLPASQIVYGYLKVSPAVVGPNNNHICNLEIKGLP